MHRHVVNIGADRLSGVDAKIAACTRLPKMFLLIQDVVLSAGYDTRSLNALNSLGNGNARQDWIWAEAFPVSAGLWTSSKRTHHRSQLH